MKATYPLPLSHSPTGRALLWIASPVAFALLQHGHLPEAVQVQASCPPLLRPTHKAWKTAGACRTDKARYAHRLFRRALRELETIERQQWTPAERLGWKKREFSSPRAD